MEMEGWKTVGDSSVQARWGLIQSDFRAVVGVLPILYLRGWSVSR